MTDDKSKKPSQDIGLAKPDLNMSPLAAWREERRLESVAKVKRKHNELLDISQDTNIGIGNLARSEVYKEEALRELTNLETHLEKTQKIRETEADAALTEANVALLKAKKEQALLQKELDEINGVQEVVTEGNVIDVDPELDNYDKHSAIAQEAEKEMAALKAQVDVLRKEAKEKGDYNDAFEKALQDDFAEQIEAVRKEAYRKSHNA